jgi:hypothetical protein
MKQKHTQEQKNNAQGFISRASQCDDPQRPTAVLTYTETNTKDRNIHNNKRTMHKVLSAAPVNVTTHKDRPLF